MKQSGDSCASVDALLLDYAYGELEGAPRRKVEAHLSGCVACRTALMTMAETRHAMAGLTPEPAPEAGLESLLAYAQQARPQPRKARFWTWLVPAISVAGASAAALLLVVGRTGDPAQSLAPAPVAAPAAAPAREGVVQLERAKDAPSKPEPEVVLEGAGRDKNEQDAKEAQTRTVAVEDGRHVERKAAAPAKRAVAKADGLGSLAQAGGGGGLAKPSSSASSMLDDVIAVAPGDARPQGKAERRDESGRAEAASASRDEDAVATTAGLVSNVAPLAGARPAPAPRPSVAPAAPPAAMQPAAEPIAVSERESTEELLAEARPKAKASAPATPEALLETAARLAATGDYASAEAAYAAFLARFPSHARAPEAALARVDVLDRLGRTREAADARVELARRWPDSAQAKVVRGGAGPHSAPAEPARLRAAPMEKKAAEAADHAPAAH